MMIKIRKKATGDTYNVFKILVDIEGTIYYLCTLISDRSIVHIPINTIEKDYEFVEII